jgi:hypothetical protein
MVADTDFIFKDAQKEEKARILCCMADKWKGSYNLALNNYPADEQCELGYDTVCRECGLTAKKLSRYVCGNRRVKGTKAIIEAMKEYLKETENDLTEKPILGVMVAAI